MKILQVNTADLRGGAETMAWNLHRAYRQKGHESWLAVGYKHTSDASVLTIPETTTPSRWVRGWRGFGQTLSSLDGKVRGFKWLGGKMQIVAEPQHSFASWRGKEDFHFSGTRHLLELPPDRPEVVHCHNLHGRYFDLRVLPWLSQRVPTVLTLHDAWLLSGHCAHSFDCERWKTGCGRCPDLSIYPAVRRDRTAPNWRQKLDIYSKSRLYIATPSRWLMRRVEQSILSAGTVEGRVIPNGVDLSVFHPANKEEARSHLGLPLHAPILLFAANGVRTNMWKDYATMRAAIAQVATRLRGDRILFVALGEEAPPDRVDGAEIRFVPYEPNPNTVARFYQAADVYVHAARIDNFPLTVLEALACGTPVVGTSVGGIPEQVDNGRTGFLVRPGDAGGMAEAIVGLLTNDARRRQFSAEATKTARERFDVNQQAEAYLTWFREIVENAPLGDHGTEAGGGAGRATPSGVAAR